MSNELKEDSMTKVNPATDEEIAYQRKVASDWRDSFGEDGLMWPGSFVVTLFARLEADREEIARLKAEVERLTLTVCRACVPTAAEPQPSGFDGNASPPEVSVKKDFQIICGTGRTR